MATSINTSTPEVTRGAIRLMLDLGYAPLTEVSLTNRRRADIVALNRKGRPVIVEVKSGVADYRADKKWTDYLAYCEEFYFAVDRDFPLDLFDEPDSLPDRVGLILADAFGADIIRPAATMPVNAARLKALTLKIARTGALRLAAAYGAPQAGAQIEP